MHLQKTTFWRDCLMLLIEGESVEGITNLEPLQSRLIFTCCVWLSMQDYRRLYWWQDWVGWSSVLATGTATHWRSAVLLTPLHSTHLQPANQSQIQIQQISYHFSLSQNKCNQITSNYLKAENIFHIGCWGKWKVKKIIELRNLLILQKISPTQIYNLSNQIKRGWC